MLKSNQEVDIMNLNELTKIASSEEKIRTVSERKGLYKRDRRILELCKRETIKVSRSE